MASFTANTITNPVTLYICATDEMSDGIMDDYKQAADKHNKKIYEGDPYVDSGFDIFQIKDEDVLANTHKKISLGIKCAAFTHPGTYNVDNITGVENPIPKAFKLHARSSLSRTYLRLANNVGIIDRGYRGVIGAMVDNIYPYGFERIEKGKRLFQICMPDLEPFIVKFCGRDHGILNETQRGSGGFGSTGGTI